MLSLPRLRARVGKRGGTRYYFDAGGTPRRWIALGSHEPTVERRYRELIATPKPAAASVDAMLADLIEHLRSKVSTGTLRNYKVHRRHLAAVFQDPLEITQADVLRYAKLCPRMTFRAEIALLSQAFVLWMDKGLLTENPCFGVKVKRKGSRRTRLLTGEEIDAIVAKADERTAIAIELAYATGLRIGDLCRLRWADLGQEFRTQKTGARITIDPSDVLAPILDRARALQARVASLYVLCKRNGGRWTPDALRDQWQKAVTAAGVKDARFHDLRAAAATAVDRELGPRAAQDFLTHKQFATTRLYLRDRRTTVVKAIRRKA